MPPTLVAPHCHSNRAVDAQRGQWWMPTPNSDAQVVMACPACGGVKVLRTADNWRKIGPEGDVPGGFTCPRVPCMHRAPMLRLQGWGRVPMLATIDTSPQGEGRPFSRRKS